MRESGRPGKLNRRFAVSLAIAETDELIARKGSVVKVAYKLKYKHRADDAGIRGKAAKRSAWDWLAQEIAAVALTDKAKLKVDEFLALLDANGVDHSRWTNRSAGLGRPAADDRAARPAAQLVAERGRALLRGDGIYERLADTRT